MVCEGGRLLHLTEGLDRLKSAYARLALVTSAEQAARIEDDGETLIVSCDWLLWQELSEAGRPAVFYELGLLDWDDLDQLDSQLFIRANDWVYDAQGRDVTLFRGVSLGKLLTGDCSMALINFARMDRSLAVLAERFAAREFIFFDYSNEISTLGGEQRRALVRGLAEERGLAFTDRSAEAAGEFLVAEKAAPPPPKGGWRGRLACLYSRLADLVTGLAALARPGRRRVLLLVNTNLAEPLVRNFTGRGVVGFLNARTLPKRLGLVAHCLATGFRLAHLDRARPAPADQVVVQAIRDDLAALFQQPASRRLAFLRGHVRTRVLGPGQLEGLAAEVRAAEATLDRLRPERIVVDGVRNRPPRVYLELARPRGIKVDYIWHSILAPGRKLYDALGCDAREPALVDRVLAWGRANEQWVESIGAEVGVERVGCPIGDRYREPCHRPPAKSPAETNVLLLQYTPASTDLRGLNANMYSSFIEVTRLLAERGYRAIRLKLHPGPGRWKKSYFERIAARFGISLEIQKFEPFHECAAWADLVIGPGHSGAFFETLAAGKRYLPLIMRPHSYDLRYYDSYPISETMDDLARALDALPPDGSALLENFYATGEFPNSSRRVWQVLVGAGRV